MYDFLTAAEPDARVAQLRAYRSYLIERDGEVDVPRRTLSKREPQLLRFEGVAPRYPMDRELFAARYANFDARKPTDPEMLLLLALCKMNAAEAYGVEATFALAEQRAYANGDGDIDLRVLIEEHYHTRILRSSAREYGIEVTTTFQPPVTLRGLIGSIAALPSTLARPLVLASELVFTLLFAQIFEKTGQILRGELRDRVQERIVEILIDEVGHVTFNRLHLGGWGMFQARRLLPLVAAGMSNMGKEWAPLGINTSTDQRWLQRMPDEVMRRAFVLREAAPYVAVAA